MNMVAIKTQDLTKISLDWAVGKALGLDVKVPSHTPDWSEEDQWLTYNVDGNPIPLQRWSRDWASAGPLIEEYKCFPREESEGLYVASKFNGVCYANTQFGSTPLEASMRCFVNIHLGDEVEVPEELLSNIKPSNQVKP